MAGKSGEKTPPSSWEDVNKHRVIVICITAIAAFVAGFAAHKEITSDRVLMSQGQLDEYVKVHASADVRAERDAATKSLNEHIHVLEEELARKTQALESAEKQLSAEENELVDARRRLGEMGSEISQARNASVTASEKVRSLEEQLKARRCLPEFVSFRITSNGSLNPPHGMGISIVPWALRDNGLSFKLRNVGDGTMSPEVWIGPTKTGELPDFEGRHWRLIVPFYNGVNKGQVGTALPAGDSNLLLESAQVVVEAASQ